MNPDGQHKDKNKIHFWLILLCLFLASLILGIIGFRQYYWHHNEDYSFLRSLYSTLQLYVLKSGDHEGPIPMALQYARFIAPLVPIITIIIAALQLFQDQWTRWKISLLKNHIIIIGFGTKGRIIMEEFINEGKRVLVIDSNRDNANFGYIKSSKCLLMIADATNIVTLEKANILKAEKVFLLSSDDNLQLNTCLQIYQLVSIIKNNTNSPLTCIMHLKNHEYLSLMKTHKLIEHSGNAFNLRIFNIYENSARDLFEQYPPDRDGITIGDTRYVQIIIFGFGHTGEAIALQTAQLGHYINGKKPRVIIIDKIANDKVNDFCNRYPSFRDFCELESETIDINSPQLINKLTPYLETKDSLNSIVICFDNKTQNFLLALKLGDALKEQESSNILVRTNDDAVYTMFPRMIKLFGSPTKACCQEIYLNQKNDKRAKAFHSTHFEIRKLAPDFGENLADVEWDELSQEFQDSNRQTADHISIKIRAIGCKIVLNSDAGEPTFFSTHEIEMLAKLEHKRWCAERSLAGWTYGDNKNDLTRKSPYLVSWGNLSEDIKNLDRNTVKIIPEVLAAENLKIIRK